MATIRRINTIKVQFKASASRPTAMELHQWTQQTLKINSDNINMLQLNAQEKALYIKVISPLLYENIMQQFEGERGFKYESGEITQVKISRAESSATTIRMFNLPPEMPTKMINETLKKFGEVLSVRDEQWSTAFPLQVNNGVKAIKIEIKRHIPSALAIGGYTVHITYVGQPIVCFGCHEEGHKKEECPKKKTILKINVQQRSALLSDIVRGTHLNKDEGSVTTENNEVNNTAGTTLGEDDTDTASETEILKTAQENINKENTDKIIKRSKEEEAEEIGQRSDEFEKEEESMEIINENSEPADKTKGNVNKEMSEEENQGYTERQPIKKLKQSQETQRDPRLKDKDKNITEKSIGTAHSKVKNTPRPHPYAVYGRNKEIGRKESEEEGHQQKE